MSRHLVDWIGSEEHPLSDAGVPAETLEDFERVIRPIVEKAPLRWESRRRDFRALKRDDQLWDQYVELVIASNIAVAGIEFEYQDFPDLVLADFGIEITARHTKGGKAELQTELQWIEKDLIDRAQKKAHQAGRLPTVLIFDIAGAGNSFLRNSEVWVPRLRELVSDLEPFIGVVVTQTSYGATRPLSLNAVFLHSSAVPQGWSAVWEAISGQPTHAMGSAQ